MNIQRKMIFITGLVIIVLAIGGMSNDISACPKHCGPPRRGITTMVPFYTVHQPMVPPGFPYKGISAQVVDFEENKMAVKETQKVSEQDYKNMPARAAEGITFSFPMLGGNKKGCILSFEKKDDMDTLKNICQYLFKPEV